MTFYRSDALPVTQITVSKHRNRPTYRQNHTIISNFYDDKPFYEAELWSVKHIYCL